MKSIEELNDDRVKIKEAYDLINERYEDFVRCLGGVPNLGGGLFRDVSISINENRSLKVQYLNRELLIHYNYYYDEEKKGVIDCLLRTKEDKYTVLHSFKYDETGMTDIEPRNDGSGYAINDGRDVADILLFWLNIAFNKTPL